LRGQKFQCADIVSTSQDEIIVKTLTQSQCYGEYHCFHAKLKPDNLVDLHVGAPTPNVEHACLRPSFDIDVPYLLATLMQTTSLDLLTSAQPVQQSKSRPVSPIMPNHLESDVSQNEEKSENLIKIGQHAIKLLKQYQSEFSGKMEQLMTNFVNQVKMLCIDEL
jgi:hypothetical protein